MILSEPPWKVVRPPDQDSAGTRDGDTTPQPTYHYHELQGMATITTAVQALTGTMQKGAANLSSIGKLCTRGSAVWR